MKTSNIPSSIIAKYAHILTGIVFITTSMSPLATSVMAQTATTLTATAQTRTHVIPANGEVVYRVKVTNPTANIAYKVNVTNVLPTGFSYGKHITTLQKGAVKFGTATKFLDAAYTTKPVQGNSTLVWDKLTIPANGSIEFIFTAKASSIASTTTPYSMSSLTVSSYSSDASTTVIPGTASVTGSADDVTVKPIPPTPTLTVSSSGTSTYIAPICAQPGAQGVGANLTGIVNTYFKPAMQSVAAGSNEIVIASGAAKGGTTPDNIQSGDLVLIVQMQDASINTTDTANSAAYGSGNILNQGSGQTSMGSSGLYEYAIATSAVSATNGNTTLKLRRPLINSYRSADATQTSGQKRFQVIRVPQYSSVKILGTMFASPWDGNVGGILAVDAFGTFDLNGQAMSVNEVGFRGGFGLRNNNIQAQEGFAAKTNVYSMNSSGTVLVNSDNTPQSITTSNTLGSGKGEGVAGTPRFVATKALSPNVEPGTLAPIWTGGFTDNKNDGYPGGDTGRGAPANAGGGANAHNAGGGGGGNGGNGGQGSLGYGYNSVLKDAGGRPGSSSLLNTPTPTKVFLGGGGGGGEANDSPQGVPGGAGGGIVMLRAGTIVGSGTIYANGTNGDRGAFGANPDGGGGGGAGGTVLIQSRNPTSASITIEAKGGKGGSTERDSFYDYAGSPVTDYTKQTNGNGYGPDGYVYSNDGRTPHGPGGGGAGGIVLYNVTSTATIIPAVTGGLSGLTDDPSPLASFSALGGKTQHSNGATAGSSGQVVPFSSSDDLFTDLNAQTTCSPANLKVDVSTTTQNASKLSTVSYKVKVTNPSSSGGATGVSVDNVLPTGFTYRSILASGGIILSGGATQSSVVTPTTGSTRPVWGKFVIPPGASVEINFTATIGSTAVNGLNKLIVNTTSPDPRRVSDSAPEASNGSSEGSGGTITVKPSVPMVWNVSPTIRIAHK